MPDEPAAPPTISLVANGAGSGPEHSPRLRPSVIAATLMGLLRCSCCHIDA